MKRTILLLAVSILFSGNVFAQQTADDFVRNSKTVPNFLDVKSGWVHDVARDEKSTDGSQAVHYYLNKMNGLIAFVSTQVNKDGSELEVAIRYGSANVGRNGIKINGRWYAGREPFFDNPNPKPDSEFIVQEVKNSQGVITGYKLGLDTVDGLKELIINF
jgi:hypothetical protein